MAMEARIKANWKIVKEEQMMRMKEVVPEEPQQ